MLARMLDETEFLSPYGLRSLSRFHRDHPLVLALDGGGSVRLDYEPGESQTALFGGNSNWRGPIWFPLNFLAVGSLRNLHASLGDEFTVEMPTGSGTQTHLGAVADEIERRLLRLFLRDADGHRPVNSGTPRFDEDPGVERPGLLPRIFPWRNGSGARSFSPNRLDGADRGVRCGADGSKVSPTILHLLRRRDATSRVDWSDKWTAHRVGSEFRPPQTTENVGNTIVQWLSTDDAGIVSLVEQVADSDSGPSQASGRR